MQKDVLYIDVEDDITAIIGKVKAAKHSIVALVPPKRVGVLQSAVNLQLLARVATQHDKKLVLISGNNALASLAAAAKIPVAKNLQSKPELAEIAALEVDNGDDVIDGAELPVGEHASQVQPEAMAPLGAAALKKDKSEKSRLGAVGAASAGAKAKPKGAAGRKVPDFNTFRKKFVIIGAALVGLIAFLIWAIVYAPHATVVLSARTTDAAVNQRVALSADQDSSAQDNRLRVAAQQQQQPISIPFSATGKKDVGDKATGGVRFSNSSRSSQTLSAGTSLQTSGGLTFTLTSSVTVPAASLSFDCDGLICPGTATGRVEAAERGTKYNAASGRLSGAPGGVNASLSDATSGGTDKTISVVTQADIDAAQQKADQQINASNARDQLAAKFDKNHLALQDTFRADKGEVKSSVGAESEAPGGNATLSGTVTYTMFGVAKSELKNYLDAVIEAQFDNPDQQRVYNSGVDTAKFADVKDDNGTLSVQLSTNGKMGPRIDDTKVKEQAAGKRYGEVQSALEAINGIQSVDVKFSPFWVRSVPDNVDKISVEFKVDG